jgi:CrcB protein
VTIVLVGIGGFFGAIARYLIDGWVSDRLGGSLPFGTFVINVTGSLVLGVLFALTVERSVLPAESRGALMVGFLGAYTTFSTLMLDSWRLIEGGWPLAGLANIVGSTVVGLVAVIVGLAIGRAVA